MRGARPRFLRAAAVLTLLAASAAPSPLPAAQPAPAAAAAAAIPQAVVSSAQLVEHPAAWNGRTVVFSGEAIGEPMRRGTHAWLHLNDDAYRTGSPLDADRRLHGYNSGQAVWVPEELARRVRTFGSYRHEGDSVRVLGTFNAACREHGGDMDIHAASLEIDREGFAVTHPLHARRFGFGIALLALAGVLALLRRRAGRRSVRDGDETLRA